MDKPVLYISGAISGREDLNKPKFESATKLLRGLGYIVINPHEICAHIPPEDWSGCMKICIAKMMISDVVILLDDWRESRGAKIECDLATKVAIQTTPLETFLKTI